MDNKDKRVLRVELDDEVKKVSITGLDSDEKVVMRQDLDEDELDKVAGGAKIHDAVFLPPEYDDFFAGLGKCIKKK